MLPHEVMQQARDEFLNWQNQGVSILEISHRSKPFLALAAQTEQLLRELLAIPQNYQVLFLPGGATYQFALLPLNLLGAKTTADYVDTGIWSQKALKEAQRYCQVNIVASARSSNYTAIPPLADWKINPHAAYLHYTANETIAGLEFPWVPEVGDVPLVSDMSSNILSQPLDIKKFAVIYAATQKNLGASGLTVVIIREELLGKALAFTPTLANYQVQAENKSLYNSPPMYAWYLTNLVLHWTKKQGGVRAMLEHAARKASKLYAVIDNSQLYANKIKSEYRSRMNITFNLTRPELEPLFLQQAEQQGLLGLKGHRLAGGIRVGNYNAISQQSIDALIAFMQEFERDSRIKNR